MGDESGLYVGAGDAGYAHADDIAQWVEMDPEPGGATATAPTAAAPEGMDSARWPEVRTAAGQVVRDRLITLTLGVQTGVRNFQRSADEMIDEYIKEPPPKPITGLGAIVESLTAVCEVLIPEATVAAAIFTTAKTVYETMKPAAELLDKANEAIVARSVDEAKEHLKGLTRDLAEDADNSAPRALDLALETVNTSLDAYITAHPQPFGSDDTFYGALSDGIGIRHVPSDDAATQVYNALFPPFRKELLRTTASLHFFHEMDSDYERLDFLMDEAEKGNDPDALLDYIGADRQYWDRFLTVYRQSGRGAATSALEAHLMYGV